MIRPARPSDVPALAALAKRTWSDAFGDGVSRDGERAELEEGRSERYFAAALREKTILVAESDQVLVGYVQFGDVDIPEVEVRPGDQEFQRLYVETALHAKAGEAVRELGVEIRAGIHTGECQLDSGKVRGIAVHTGARIAALAGPGEVLISHTVKDLVAGSGLEFEDRGVHELKGVPGEWRVYAAL
jgi:class 3 adenylate cyclase